MQSGIVLLGHGSRDPLWRAPIEAVAAAIQQREPAPAVVCAYLELCEPLLPGALRQLEEAGVTRVTIVPMFLGTGKHARSDLPILVDGLRLAHPLIHVSVQPPIGEHPAMTALMAAIACAQEDPFDLRNA